MPIAATLRRTSRVHLVRATRDGSMRVANQGAKRLAHAQPSPRDAMGGQRRSRGRS